jgi:hypothetical protein
LSRFSAGPVVGSFSSPRSTALGLSTVIDFERERRVVSETAASAMQAALEAAGVEFTNGSEPGVKLKAKPQSIAGEDLNASNDE